MSSAAPVESVKEPKFKLFVDENGNVLIVGRPNFNSDAKGIDVKEGEDRRHILHWSEDLKPILQHIFTILRKLKIGDQISLLQNALKSIGATRIPATPERLMIRLATVVNSATVNLVAGDADINKAIEHVRGNISKLIEVVTDSNFDFLEVDKQSLEENNARMKAIYEATKKILDQDYSTDIKSSRSRIHKSMLEMIEHCSSPAELWQLLHNLVYSVTFDLSSKAVREQTAHVMEWQRMMKSTTEWPIKDQIAALMTILK